MKSSPEIQNLHSMLKVKLDLDGDNDENSITFHNNATGMILDNS